MKTWNALLLIYCEIDVRYPVSRWRRKHFAHQLSAAEVDEAEDSFRHFPPLVTELTDGRASIDYAIVHVQEPLRRVSAISHGGFWPSPHDTHDEIERFAPRGDFDSVFVFWPQRNCENERAIPSYGWGYGMGATDETNGATYATVANAPSAAWKRPRVGEVWLHEWLHGVCHHFAQGGHIMPEGDADGGGRHGYVQSETSGWCDYYRDLMNGRVAERNELKGIASSAWLEADLQRSTPV
ncbi:MAG: hypothetical protein M3032_09135 [Verrucomicrobiota bacterium]|nr:hypothetical protein [Verrucomicrobiota bacterium]